MSNSRQNLPGLYSCRMHCTTSARKGQVLFDYARGGYGNTNFSAPRQLEQQGLRPK